MVPTILLIEDNPDHQCHVARTLREADESFEVIVAETGRAGIRALDDQRIDCVVLDYKLPDTDGLHCLRAIREAHGDVPVVMLTGQGSEEVVLEAWRLGVTTYVRKHGLYPKDLLAQVREVLRRVEGAYTREQPRGQRLAWELRERFRREGIIGQSDALEEALVLAEQAAQCAGTVLLEGETGTGKELFARAIHAHGPRARAPFLAQNCAALPETLLECELFGCVRGAYTGADRARHGLFEAANGGTIFLDEIGEMPTSSQARLLRVLEDGVVRPLGSNDGRTVDVRVIAATNRDPLRSMRLGEFREDLYYRLHVLPIRLPPLRERHGDIRLLAAHFLRRHARAGSSLERFDERALRLLESYSWPGNVRELENEILRIQSGAPRDHQSVTPALLSPRLQGRAIGANVTEASLQDILDDDTRRIIRDRLQRFEGNRQRTAASLGITREWLWALMKRLGIMPPRKLDS